MCRWRWAKDRIILLDFMVTARCSTFEVNMIFPNYVAKLRHACSIRECSFHVYLLPFQCKHIAYEFFLVSLIIVLSFKQTFQLSSALILVYVIFYYYFFFWHPLSPKLYKSEVLNYVRLFFGIIYAPVHKKILFISS